MRKPIGVYIIDDEALLIEGVSKMITQGFAGFAILGSAQNGAKALEEIPLLHPDLVLVDINMPGLNGLDVIKELRFRGIDVTVALLTAYERFDIAKSAFGLGVSSYILKPVTQRKLDDALPALEIEIRKKQDLQRQFRDRASSTGNQQDLLISAFLYFSFLGKEEAAGAYLQAAGLGEEAYTFVHCRFDSEHRGEVEECLRAYGFVQAVLGKTLLYRRLFFLLRGDLRDEVRKWTKDHRCPGDWEFLLLTAGSNPFASIRKEAGPVGMVERDLLDMELFYAGDLLGLRTRVLGLSESLGAGKLLSLRSQLCAFGARLLKSIGERLGKLPMELEEFFAELLEQEQAEELVESFLSRIHLWRLYFLEHQTLSDLVMRAKACLTRDLGLSVEEVATELRVSLAHLSRQFSSEVGLSMTQYTTHLRLEKAKGLLSEGNMPIKEIAGLCGFGDSGYFAKVFKKHTGVSPKSFQKGGEEAEYSEKDSQKASQKDRGDRNE